MVATPSLTFLGAVDTVTGSRFLLETPSTRVLVDAGLYQGLKELRRRNWDELPVPAASIQHVIVTHAHLDHCGYLPRLVAQGFTGRIFMTRYTADLVKIVLEDSARIQVEDAAHAKRHGYSKHQEPLPLYDEDDVATTLQRIQVVPFHEDVAVTEDLRVRFHHSSHILGAAFAEIHAGDKRVLFSGDFGRASHPLLAAPDPLPSGRFDALVIESTYGNRPHPAPSAHFADTIAATFRRGGTVLIPAFAVDRTELILMSLKKLMASGAIPTVPVYVDSPMALSALSIYRDAIAHRDGEIRPEVLDLAEDPFDCGELHEARTVEESKALNDPPRRCVIISASGMATGGRVVHHLENILPDQRNAVILVGYQAAGTRGQFLLAGHHEIKMYGNYVPVRAHVVDVEEFSVHADAPELIDWLRPGARPGALYLVHGEPDSAASFAQQIEQQLHWPVTRPVYARTYQL